jgi:hypothetical protein
MVSKKNVVQQVVESYYGALFYVSFEYSITRQQRLVLERNIFNLFGFTVTKATGKSMVFFVPNENLEKVDGVCNWINENYGRIRQQMVLKNEDNKKFIQTNVVDLMLDQLKELNSIRDRTMLFARRTTKYKNVTKAYLELRAYGEFYSKMLGFPNARFNEQIDKSIGMLKQNLEYIYS